MRHAWLAIQRKACTGCRARRRQAVPGSFASVPLGAALPGSAERNPSGIPSAAI
jgi:hypothetical protein